MTGLGDRSGRAPRTAPRGLCRSACASRRSLGTLSLFSAVISSPGGLLTDTSLPITATGGPGMGRSRVALLHRRRRAHLQVGVAAQQLVGFPRRCGIGVDDEVAE